MFLPDKRAGGLLALILTMTMTASVAGQRVPPGVNPKRYQQHPEQDQYQEDIIGIHHHHHHQDQAQQVLTRGNIQQERTHIQEHMPVPIDTSHMSEQELQFHYFKVLDWDNNNKLDGCELLKSLILWHEDSKDQPQERLEKKLTDEELAALIDPILHSDDTSGDGFIDYLEFVKSQERKRQRQKQNQAVY